MKTSHLIKTLIAHLPRHAEEDGDFYVVERCQLVAALCRKQDIDQAFAELKFPCFRDTAPGSRMLEYFDALSKHSPGGYP